ncbi:MAG: HDOD domain-containing protein [Pirellulaceae bacterium]|jgi:HD-like signal output (HDOD) protein|nr:HDOD domain-containing protein [Pirellulaceae bacterium]MDP7018861.1 HDOD domain-containing protein [Pirellulaceae bacterium]
MSNSEKPTLPELLSGAQLPALPQSAIRLLELSQDPNNGPPEFAVPIESDPGLTGQVLRFVNSSYFGFSQEVSSVRLAITLVGVRTIKNFSLWSAVFSLMPNPKCGDFDLKALWQDSLRRALFARALGRQLQIKDPEELFTAALLQDMAVPLLAKERPDDYVELLNNRDGGRRQLSHLELERFGWHHGQAAAFIARGWGLPQTFGQLLETHAESKSWLDDPSTSPERAAVGVSSLLPSIIDEQWAERVECESAYERIAGRCAEPLAAVFAQVDTDFAEFAPVIKLGTPSCSLVDYLDIGESVAP